MTVKPEEITGIGGGDPEQPQHEQTQTTQAQPIGKISEGNLLNNMAFISEAEENEGEFTTIEHNVSIQGSNTDISAKQTKKKAEKILGIESYQLTKGKNGENAFGLHGEEIAFVERDKEIELFKHDESAVLAALQLANNKWRNGIKVEGNKEYLDLCMKLAEEHNLKIQVPKEYLKEREAELRKQKREQPEQLVAGQKPEVEDGSIDAYNYARQVALHKTKRVIDAIPEKSYKGEVVEKESGFILLKTGKDEIAIVSEKSLSLNSNLEIGDNVKLEKQRPNAARRDVAKLEQDRGR